MIAIQIFHSLMQKGASRAKLQNFERPLISKNISVTRNFLPGKYSFLRSFNCEIKLFFSLFGIMISNHPFHCLV